MKRSFQFLTGFALILPLLLFTGCDKPEDQVLPQESTSRARIGDFAPIISNGGFDPELFANKLEMYLKGKVPGAGYRIWVNGQPFSKGSTGVGKARYPIDAPELAYTPTVRQDVAGCTQFVTALTVLRILERNGKSAQEPVWPYLPSYFKPHPDFKKLRFIDLLSHTSGLVDLSPGTPNDYVEDIQATVESGIQLSEFTNNQYDQEPMNYTICRLLVPYLIAKLEDPTILNILKQIEGNAIQLNLYTSLTFLEQVRSAVLKPAGIGTWNQVDFQPWGGSSNQLAKFYPTNLANSPGLNGVSRVKTSGAVGLYINANELAQVVAAARAGKIVSANTYQLMKLGKSLKHSLGFDDAFDGKHGSYYYKHSYMEDYSGGNLSAAIIDFHGDSGEPLNVQLVLTANMPNKVATHPIILSQIFDESWK
ncbi:serine hydrolase [Larkinella sp. GY13]|uniref:serine hydrolase n=1 Tax=Larkinella sp. GY13 TaxID=3453720 RepID=UPI003EEC66BD